MSVLSKLDELGKRRRGFRFSAVDLLAILICAIATWLLFPVIGTTVWLLPITLGHFFLFCNVFRIHRNAELFWAATFIVNVAAWSLLSDIDWLKILAVQSFVTVTLIAKAFRSRSYHGIFCSPLPNA